MDYTQRSIELLGNLVRFASVSRDSNLPLIHFIENYLAEHGIQSQIIPSADGTKANLLARIGDASEDGIVLSGHTDVVPIDGQSWDFPPFSLSEKDGKLYGRGTADMKSFVAICLAFAPHWAKLSLKKPLYLAFSYDEEVGCLGVPFLVEHLQRHHPRPALAIIGEPTMMEVVTAHKGVWSYHTTVTGHEWHSSQPHYGVNAIQIAAQLIHFLGELGERCKAPRRKDERFDPPYTTVHVGIMHGGTARNIIPKECYFQWEIRPLPGDDPQAIQDEFSAYADMLRAKMQATHSECNISTQPMSRMSAVTLPAHSDSARELVMHCAKRNSEVAVSFGTEAGVFGQHAIPAIVCGPGNIAQAHKPNEFIEISQIEAGVAFMYRLTEQLTKSL